MLCSEKFWRTKINRHDLHQWSTDGSDQDDTTLSDYVRSDISGFKARFQKGDVHQAEAILLPNSKMEVPLYTFISGEEEHNAIEQVAYIQDASERVLTVVLSAKTEADWGFR
jgi:hypothetical protein